MLRRLWRYGQKRLGVETACDRVVEYHRRRPAFPAAQIIRALLTMMLTRVGSLHAMAMVGADRTRRWSPLTVQPSDDTLSRGLDGLGSNAVRSILAHCFERLVRMKALRPRHGMWTIVIDAHESHASFDHCCRACLRRVVATKNGDRIEYYHRHVTALVPALPYCVALDIEPIRPGEDEVAAARRLILRILRRFPRLFRLVLADSFYPQGAFFNFLREHRLHVMTVLKQEARLLMQEARLLRQSVQPVHFRINEVDYSVWDIPSEDTWDSCACPVRVIINEERHRNEKDNANWVWVTTLDQDAHPAATLVPVGHDRWCIENQGFNELSNHWHADHVYRHSPEAILASILLTMLAHLLFHQFYWHNLSHHFRRSHSKLHVARRLLAELYFTPPVPSADTS